MNIIILYILIGYFVQMALACGFNGWFGVRLPKSFLDFLLITILPYAIYLRIMKKHE